MIRVSKLAAFVLTTLLAVAAPVAAQQIENELVLITPVARTLTDPALAEFAKYAKEKWNVNVKTSALAAGTPVAYGRIVEWKGRPEADIFWGGESALFDKLAEQKLLAKLDLPKSVVDSIPDSIGKPKPIPLKDPRDTGSARFSSPTAWSITAAVSAPRHRAAEGLGRSAQPEIEGQRRAVRAHPLLQQPRDLRVILQRDGDEKGWTWLKRLGGNTGIFTARSRDVPAVVARGEFAAGFAVPSYMAFEDRLPGTTSSSWPRKPRGSRPSRSASSRAPSVPGRRSPLSSSCFRNAARTWPWSAAYSRSHRNSASRASRFPGGMAVEFTGGIRSYFDVEVTNIYDDDKAQGRYEQVNSQFRKEIESVADELKKK